MWLFFSKLTTFVIIIIIIIIIIITIILQHYSLLKILASQTIFLYSRWYLMMACLNLT